MKRFWDLFPKLSNSTLEDQHAAIRGVPKEERSDQDWAETITALESEMEKRGLTFESIS